MAVFVKEMPDFADAVCLDQPSIRSIRVVRAYRISSYCSASWKPSPELQFCLEEVLSWAGQDRSRSQRRGP